MFLIDKPMLFAVFFEGIQVVCAVNIVMPIPHMPKKSLHVKQLFVSWLVCVDKHMTKYAAAVPLLSFGLKDQYVIVILWGN